VNHPNFCGACDVNCLGADRHPDALGVDCVEHRCRISLCVFGRVDQDGEFNNGCEATAEVGPGGPYASCAYATREQDCGLAETCVTVGALAILPPIGASLTLVACEAGMTDCFCGMRCRTAEDCPAVPSGPAVAACRGERCALECTTTEQCPIGMQCSTVQGTGDQSCVY
jgi:hypothetical protein